MFPVVTYNTIQTAMCNVHTQHGSKNVIILKSLSDLERTEKQHLTVEKWVKEVNEKRILALKFCGDACPAYALAQVAGCNLR